MSTLLPLAAPPQSVSDPRIVKAAQDFTAVALNEMLSHMFETDSAAGGAFGGGDGEKAWRPMMVQEMAKAIAGQGGLGLTEPIARQMLAMQEAASKEPTP